jgi:hypothetical protein
VKPATFAPRLRRRTLSDKRAITTYTASSWLPSKRRSSDAQSRCDLIAGRPRVAAALEPGIVTPKRLPWPAPYTAATPSDRCCCCLKSLAARSGYAGISSVPGTRLTRVRRHHAPGRHHGRRTVSVKVGSAQTPRPSTNAESTTAQSRTGASTFLGEGTCVLRALR